MVDKPTVHPVSNDAAEKDDGSAVTRSRAQSQETSNTSYSSYLFGRAGESDKPLWSDSTKGRATIRLVSRGIVGALAMTVVDRISRRQLQGVHAGKRQGLERLVDVNPSQKIAKAYDAVFGTPIQAFVHAISPAGKTAEGMLIKDAYKRNSTHFRYKSYYHDHPGHMSGHSLGAEIVQVTASFAAGSLGDAGTRNIIQVFDPNNVKAWMVNDRGEAAKPGEKKHLDLGKWAASTARTTWARVLSKNMGEDWAVALPYVYQMRWQRGLLANHFHDSKLVLDNSLNGGSFLVNHDGQLKGDFQLPGAIDLHTRFVGYNWYTLMYRETYDAIGRQFGKWHDKGFSMPHLPSNPVAAVFDTLGYGARYVTKSFIKANLYMNPAVIPFWAVRVSQSKWRAPVIVTHQDGLNAFAQKSRSTGPSEFLVQDEFGNNRYMYDTMGNAFIPGRDTGGMFAEGVQQRLDSRRFEGGNAYSWNTAKELIKTNTAKGLFSAAILPFGWASYHTGSAATKLGAMLPSGGVVGNFLNNERKGIYQNVSQKAWQRQHFMRSLVDNSFSYTPYMIAKAETALRVDERPADGGLGAMDKAIYKFIDSTVRFDLKGAGQAIKDIGHNSVDMGREVKMREGGELSASQVQAKTPMAPEDRPTQHVHARSIKRDPNLRERASDSEPDKNWAESVTGKALDGRFMAGPASIH